MVKRKAATSLDEWLTSGVEIAKPTPTSEVVNEGAEVTVAAPTAKVRTEVKEGPASEANADVAVNDQEVADWFWSLLETLGYELW